MRISKINLEANESKLAYFLITPSIILVFVILIYPLIYSIYISFTNIEIRTAGEVYFVGFNNYVKAFVDPYFRGALVRTLYFALGTVFLKLVLGLIVALVLHQQFFGRGLVRTLIILPWATPLVVTGIMWKWMLNPSIGIINYLLKKIGLIEKYIVWLGDMRFAMPWVIIADVWQGAPFFVILLLAGLQTIPGELYEAAMIDGAGSWQRFRRITLPLIKFPIFIVTILGTISALNAFDLIFILTKGGPGGATKMATYFVWMNAFKFFHLNYSSAISYIIMTMALIISFAYIYILRRGKR
ncbi:MAG: sugar ABC transporter permease [Actinobacteria bacterium]|nr:sugar ABC transporter permease [Actinomycetota bacterium]MCL5987139.1 sugar ABC transporter permease [Actinomycetota bacterium]